MAARTVSRMARICQLSMRKSMENMYTVKVADLSFKVGVGYLNNWDITPPSKRD
jgi:hypothetical protein